MEKKRDLEEGAMKQNATPVLDSRWPFPVVLIFLFTSILIPSIAILAIYAPILAEAVSYHPQIYALEYSCGTVILAVVAILVVIFSFIALIYSSLSPVIVIQIGVISTLLWGTEVGVSSVFWEKNHTEICAGKWGEAAWQCDYAWLTPLCASIAAAASLIITLLSWHSLVRITSPPINPKLKQESTEVVPLGPPATPPVNLPNKRRGPGLIHEVDLPARPIGFYTTVQSGYPTAGGVGKLVLPTLPPRLDPTNSGFVPGAVIYAPQIPDPRVRGKKGKAREKGKGKAAVKTPVDQNLHKGRPGGITAEFLSGDPSQRNRVREHVLAPISAPELEKALPPAPVPNALTGSGSNIGLLRREAPRPGTTSTSSRTNPRHSSFGFPGSMSEQTLTIPPRQPRRISSFPGSSDDRMYYDQQSPRGSEFYPMSGNGGGGNLQQQYGGSQRADARGSMPSPKPVQQPFVVIPPPTPRYPAVTRKPVPHAPHISSGLASSVILANANASEREERSGPAVVSLGPQKSCERSVAGLPHRLTHSRSASTGSSPVPSSATINFPKPSSLETPAVIHDSHSEPTPGPVTRSTYSSEESDETIDPEKIALVQEQLAQQVEEERASKKQEMMEAPQAQSLTLSVQNVKHVSPTPVPIRKNHPVLDLSRAINSGASNAPRRLSETQSHLVPGSPLHSTTEQDNNRGREDRYTTVPPLQITKELPSIPPLPPRPHSPTPQPPTPPTPRTPRTPISERSKCVGHFTVSSTGEVEVSSGSYRPMIDSLSSSRPGAAELSSPASAHHQGEDLEARHKVQRLSKLNEKLPIAGRKRSSSGPASYVHFELTQNKAY